MVELANKGASASISKSDLKGLMVTMKWTTGADFDVMAVYEDQSGPVGIVYFGDKGNANAHPFMTLSKDAGVGDTGGNNEEELTIHDATKHTKIHILCSDFGAIQKGQPARFAQSDVRLEVMDQDGNNIPVKLDTGQLGNICRIATIEVGPMGGKLVNTSSATTLKSWGPWEPIVAFLKS